MNKIKKDQPDRVEDDKILEEFWEETYAKENPKEYLLYSHGIIYSEILQIYNKNIKISVYTKLLLKCLFFLIIMSVLITVLFLFGKTLHDTLDMITSKNITDLSIESVLSVATIMISSVSSVLVAFIKLPEIIARYLFNENEDDTMNDIIKSIQNHDKDILELNYNETANKLIKQQKISKEKEKHDKGKNKKA